MMKHVLSILFLFLSLSALSGKPTILMYSGPISKLGGYTELLLGVSESNKSFGYLSINGVKDTIVGGGEEFLEGKNGMYDQASGHVELRLSSGRWVHVYGYRTDQLKVEYYDFGKPVKFKLLKRKLEAAITGLYELKNDSITAKVYIYQIVGDDYINVNLYDNWKEYKFYGPIESKTYGEYIVNLKPEREIKLIARKNEIEIKTNGHSLVIPKQE